MASNTQTGDTPVDDEKRGQYFAAHNHDQDTRREVLDRVIKGAKAAAEKEQNMTLLQGIRLYPRAIAWSFLVSTIIVMEGYDICLINNFCERPRIAPGFCPT
jgi:SP family general alpha glucoside:H+ symporter-like MFS transporter